MKLELRTMVLSASKIVSELIVVVVPETVRLPETTILFTLSVLEIEALPDT